VYIRYKYLVNDKEILPESLRNLLRVCGGGGNKKTFKKATHNKYDI
jgi:hypothetical protein